MTVLLRRSFFVATALSAAAAAAALRPCETGIGWKDGWVKAWAGDVPGLQVRDTTIRLSDSLTKVVRRWTWTGDRPLEEAVLSVRYRVEGDPADWKPYLPGILMYGNPSNRGRTDGRVPVYEGRAGEFAQFEDHRYPMPFALLENAKTGAFVAVHVLPSPVRGARREDLWWSLGVEAKVACAEIVLLSGPVGYNGRRSVVKAQQGGSFDYDEAYVALEPGQVVEKTFWIQTGRATPEAFGFEQALDVSLDIFRPFDAGRSVTMAEIARRKRDYAMTRWIEGPRPGVCGFNMYDARGPEPRIVLGWCGCAATCGYALPVLACDPSDVEKAHRSLDFISTAFLNAFEGRKNGCFGVCCNPADGTITGGDCISCGQSLYSVLKAIRFAEKSGRADATGKWRAFALKAAESLSSDILRSDWTEPKSTGPGFLVAPLVVAGEMFGRADFIRAARRLADVFERKYFGYAGVYWGGTLDARCEDKEGAYAAFLGYLELLRHAVETKDAADERRYARLARHAMNQMLTYTMVWDATYPPGRLSDHQFKSTGWTVVSAQNQHLDAFGVLTTPEIWRMGEYLKDERLKRLAHVMYCSCFQLTDASGSLGEQIQQTNFAQHGKMDSVRDLRGGYSEGWTVFWLTAHFLNAAAQFKEMGVFESL